MSDLLPDVAPVLAQVGRGSLQRRLAALEALCRELEQAAWTGYGWDAARKCRQILERGVREQLFASSNPSKRGGSTR